MRAGEVLLVVLAVAGGAWAQYPGVGADQFVVCDLHEQCVYWQQCHEGYLNTAGIGLIDIRSPIPIPVNITNPRRCQSTGKLCCIDPDKEGLVDPGLGVCPIHHLCVPKEQCINGEINTSGIGIIDQRIQGVPCTNPEYPDVPAECCKRPAPLPLVTCPSFDQVCRYAHECDASSGIYELGGVGCYVDPASGIDGVCCSQPVVSQCSSGRVCVTQAQCTAQGFVNTDGSGNIDVRILDRCNLGTGETGVCCLGPPSEKCSEPNAICNPTGICDANKLSAPFGYTETCYRSEGSGAIGECCLKPPLPTCPASYTCNLPELCLEDPDVYTNNPNCELKGELVGVCCTKKPEPPKIVDVCPGDAVCLPEILCSDLDHITGTRTACRLSGTGFSEPGVCCTNTYPPQPPTPQVQCGVGSPDIDTRIKSDTLLKKQAKFAEFPWMGLVFFKNHTYKCGASLVDDRWVITAAHCVAGFLPTDFRVRLGEYQVDLFDTLYPYEDFDLASITIHPKFNAGNLHNDVAVLELARPVTYQHHINRICLPPPTRVHYDGQECIATGWGKDAFDGGKFQVILKKVILPVVPNDRCQNMLRQTRLGPFFKLDPSFVCAGVKAGQDSCTGDGGGPLMCLSDSGRYELYGMTAWGIGCGIEGNPGVYVNLPLFMDWVYDIMQFGPDKQQQHAVGGYSG